MLQNYVKCKIFVFGWNLLTKYFGYGIIYVLIESFNQRRRKNFGSAAKISIVRKAHRKEGFTMSKNFMMNAGIIRSELAASHAQVVKSANGVPTAYFLTLNCNTKAQNFGAIFLYGGMINDFAELCVWDNAESCVKWSGDTREHVEAHAHIKGIDTLCHWFDGFCPYNDLWKDQYEQRATATELIFKTYLETIYPPEKGFSVEHIGNHREKGWRDLLVRDVSGKAVLKVECKARLGRFAYHKGYANK